MERLLTTKLYIPQLRSNLVRRPRLIQRLNAGLNGKLTLVSAPAGFGKSTLIGEWIMSCEKSCTWFSLDESDNNLKRFLIYLIVAIQQIDESIGDEILPFLEVSDEPSIEPLITILINDIASSKEEFCLVLDDYHLITRKPIHQAINFLLEHLPPNAHIVISGRVDPPISTSRLRARDQMTEVRPDDLRFIESEAKTFLNDLYGLDLSPEDISALISRTEGWITGLQLAALSLQGRQDKHEFVRAFSGSHHYIIDYLVDEVMARQPEEIRTFLYRTSIFNRFCAPLSDAVLEISDSKRILQDLDRSNLFMVPLDDERKWYRYHHLFADFLNQRLREREPQSIPELHLQASIWFERNNFLAEAINHALEGEDFTRAARLVESVGPDMMMQSEFDQLTIWLDAMPQEHVKAWPWLCIIRAWMCQRWAQLDEGEEYLRCAESALEIETTPEPMGGEKIIRGQISAIRALFSLNQVQIPQAIEFANQALELLPDDYFNQPVATDALGIAKRIAGDFDDAIKVFVKAQRASLAVGNRILAQAILLELGRVQSLQGRIHQAAETFREAMEFKYQETEIKIPYASSASVNLANILREWDELDAAMAHLEEGITIGLPAQMMDAVVQGYAIKTRVYLVQENLDAAKESLKCAEKFLKNIPYPEIETMTTALNSQIWMLIAQDNLTEAERTLRDRGLGINDAIMHYSEIEYIILARVWIYLGRKKPEANYLPEAQGIISRMLEITESVGCIREMIELHVLQALVFSAQGINDQATDSLKEALTLGEPEGYVRTFVDEGKPMKELLRLAASQNFAKDYIADILAVFEPASTNNQLIAALSLIEPLSDRELEVLRLLNSELSGPEIAKELMVSENTMRTHTKNIYSKLNVHSRRAAVRRAEEINLF